MDTIDSLRQGTLSGERPVCSEVVKKQDPKSVGINTEDIVARIYFAFVPVLSPFITDGESNKVQAKVYEIIKDEVAQALIRIRKEGEK